jgi:hypothetical protein
MSYLSRLKQLSGDQNFTHSPSDEPTKPPKAPFVSSGSTVQGAYENISANDSAVESLSKVGADGTAEPFDREAWDERAAICEFDGGLSREDAEAIAWHEDDRRRCTQCLNRRPHDGVCKVAEPKVDAVVVANRSYAPDPVRSRRCEGYSPKASDPDQRPGAERWPGLREILQ